MAADAHYGKVSLLLHGNGSNGSTTFTDSGPAALAPSSVGGSIAISTTQSKFGGASIDALRKGELFYSNSAFALGPGDFTIEAWLLWNTASGSQQYGAFQCCTASAAYSTSTSTSISVFADTGDKWAVICNAGVKTSALTITTGAWHHLAISRISGIVYVHVNGGLILVFVDTYNYANSGLVVGGYHSASFRFDGYIDDLRITKGLGRYAGTSTAAPIAEHPDLAKTVSGLIRDDAGALCARTVRAYDRATGALIASTTSNATTGAYSLDVGDDEVQRIVLDDSGGTLYNDIIDRVIPA